MDLNLCLDNDLNLIRRLRESVVKRPFQFHVTNFSTTLKMSVDFLLHESSVGYAIFQVVHQADTIGNRLKEVQDAVQVLYILVVPSVIRLTNLRTLLSLGKWSSLSLSRPSSKSAHYYRSFYPTHNALRGAAQALENVNEVSEGIASDYLRSLLEVNLPKTGKKNKVTLGVSDKNLAGSIKGAFPGVECETGDTSEIVQDMLRGIRQHAPKLLKQLQDGDVERAQLGLGHAYSRARVKFSVQKNDNHIIQSIATLDFLDKSVNSFAMRVRGKILNSFYNKIAKFLHFY